MDICSANWNEDDNANIAAAPDGAPEGMAPSGVNNVLRAMMGASKRWYGWSSPRTTAGTATAYTLAYAVAPGALVDGMTHVVQFHAANGVAPTLNVHGLGATPIHYYAAGAWRVAPPGLLDANEIRHLSYHGSSGAYRIIDRADTTGDLVPIARPVARAGTLLCYGQAISRTSYAGLFAAIGSAYGAGDGSTTFNLPDARGRVFAGKDDMGGSNAGRLSTIGATGLGAAGGAQTESASLSATAAGGITVVSGGVMDAENVQTTISQGAGAPAVVAGVGHTHGNVVSTGSISLPVSGSTNVVTNVQPTLVANYAICI